MHFEKGYHFTGCVKPMAPTKKYGTKWIVAELIFPNFKLNQSVPVSRVYPLVADANTSRTPIHHENIAGLGTMNSLSGTFDIFVRINSCSIFIVDNIIMGSLK